MKRILYLLPFIGVLLGFMLFGVPEIAPPPMGLAPALIEAADLNIYGEYVENPAINETVLTYSKEIVVISTVTTEITFSTACEDIDMFMVRYTTSAEDKVPASAFSVPLGDVTGNEVTLVRNTDPSDSEDRAIIYTFYDYAWM